MSEISEEILRMAGKDMTDEERRDALSPVLEGKFMKIRKSTLEEEEDEDLRAVAGGIFDYIFKRIKKVLIQNLIDMSKYPALGVYVLTLLEPWIKFLSGSEVGDNSENKQDE